MKTQLIRFISLVSIFFICSSYNSFGQRMQIDSLIFSKNLKFVDGTVPMYCAVQCVNRGKEVQMNLQKIVETYSNDGENVFDLKLAVIDSSQWSGFSFPYGLFFISKNWIVIPGDLDFQKFSKVWGYNPFIDKLKNSLELISSNPEKLLTNSLYNFAVAHELGHYYMIKILNTKFADRWTSEWMASYFAMDFFKKNEKECVKALNIFQATFNNEFQPKYRNLSDFNTKYAGVGVQNYIWYHLMFLPMIEDIYSVYGEEFMQTFADRFPKTEMYKYSQEEILSIVDKITEEKGSKWLKIMAGATE